MEEATLNLTLVLTLLAMLLGLVGSILPGLPGVPLIFLAALVYSYLTDFEVVGTWVLVLLGVFAALALIADYVGTTYGARRFGASWAGTLGGAVGGIVGTLVGFLFLGIGAFFGLILGTVAGVFAGEYLKRNRATGSTQEGQEPASDGGDWRRTSRAAGGVFVGYIISAVAQGALAVVGLVAFVLALIY